VLVDDLLSAMLGLEGRAIRIAADDPPPPPGGGAGAAGGGGAAGGATAAAAPFVASSGQPPRSLRAIRFVVDVEGVDHSLAHLAQRVLPLATHYVRVRGFAATRLARHEHGRVAHALAAGVRALLKEYVASSSFSCF